MQYMKWFSPSAIVKEISKIKWPKKDELLKNSVQVIIIVAFFALFFYACQFVLSLVLRLLGVIA